MNYTYIYVGIYTTHSLFHLFNHVNLEGEHPHTEYQLVLQLEGDPAI